MSAQEQQLRSGLASLALMLPDAAIAKLLAYLGLLGKWNKVYSLTAISDAGKMVSHHLLDSLAALAPVADLQPARLLDVGSGGGQPGIPFAIARPDWRIVLLDSNQKKTTFLRQAVLELGLENVDVVCDRVEAYVPASPFDVITSRAFASLADFVNLTQHLLAPSGQWAALKGVTPTEEISALPMFCKVTGIQTLQVPDLAAERCIIMLAPTSGVTP